MNRILALDQASRNSGWAIFIDGELKDYGVLSTSQAELGDRLVKIRNFVIEKIQEWDIDLIAFEDIQLQISVGNNVKTFKTLANVYGVILETVKEFKKNYVIVASGTWKSALNIKGRTRPEQKSNATNYVVEHYNIKPSQDAVDAICIGSYIKNKNNDNNVTIVDNGFDWSK